MRYSITFILVLFLIYPAFGQNFVESDQPTPVGNALFGWASASSLGHAIITAPHYDLDGREAVGRVFYYNLEGERWSIEQEITPTSLSALSNYGISAAMNYEMAAVGSLGDPVNGLFTGAVYLYNLTDSTLTEVQRLNPSDVTLGSQFGYSLSFGVNWESILAVGAFNANGNSDKTGAVYLFEPDESGVWVQTQKLIAEDGNAHDYFGHELIFLDEHHLAISAYNADGAEERSGAVYIFERDEEGNWFQEAKLFDPEGSSSDLFGYSLTGISDVFIAVKGTANHNHSLYEGTLFIGAPGTNEEDIQKGSVYFYEESEEDNWNLVYELVEEDAEHNDHFGISLAHNAINGLYVGANRSGSANGGKIFNYDVSWGFSPENGVNQIPFISNGSGTAYYGSSLTSSHGLSDPTLIFSAPHTEVDGNENAGVAEFYVTAITSNEEESLAEITEYKLDQNYPNPFNPSTTIRYDVKEAGVVTLTLYNVLGQTVQVLVNERQNTGAYTVQFNASSLASGFYFYRLEVNNFVSTRKMMLIK
ncbi:MAG: T9SS type A sorting domain-containing protein [Bacteroidota bacterium]